MKLLNILFIGFAVALLSAKLVTGDWNFLFAGNVGMAVFLLVTGAGHFKWQKGMEMMMPQAIPFKMPIVYITGVLEILAAIGLLIPKYRVATGWLLIIFLVCILPANYASGKRNVNLFKADHSGPGLHYFWTRRLPMQLILIAWVAYFSIYLMRH